jgi:hypothetical protein
MSSVRVGRSIDHGATWTVSPTAIVTDSAFQQPSCVVHGQDVWVTYAHSVSANPPMPAAADSVRVVHSADGGATWGRAVTISAAAAGRRYLPQLVIGSNGELQAAWYEGDDQQPATLVRAWSLDGTTWQSAVIAMPGTFTTARQSYDTLYDYFGLAEGSGRTLSAYTDNSQPCTGRTGNCSHIAFIGWSD